MVVWTKKNLLDTSFDNEVQNFRIENSQILTSILRVLLIHYPGEASLIAQDLNLCSQNKSSFQTRKGRKQNQKAIDLQLRSN